MFASLAFAALFVIAGQFVVPPTMTDDLNAIVAVVAPIAEKNCGSDMECRRVPLYCKLSEEDKAPSLVLIVDSRPRPSVDGPVVTIFNLVTKHGFSTLPKHPDQLIAEQLLGAEKHAPLALSQELINELADNAKKLRDCTKNITVITTPSDEPVANHI